MKPMPPLPNGLAFVLLCSRALAAPLDTNRSEQITGLKGSSNATGSVFKLMQPRNDVSVKVDEWRMPPFMRLTSSGVFFRGRKPDVTIMGDFVLFEDEVNQMTRHLLD